MRSVYFAIALLAVLTLALSGCARATVADVAAARDECHSFGGFFTSWKTPEFGYAWNCDLSDIEEGR